jgi:hypothetical protein
VACNLSTPFRSPRANTSIRSPGIRKGFLH